MKIKHNILANFLGSAWSALLGFAFVPIYIRYLGMEAYSLVGIFSIMQAWLSMFDMGMTPTLNREMARYSAGDHTSQSIWDLLRSLEYVAAIVFGIITISVYLTSDLLAERWLKVDNLPISVVAQALSISAFVIGLRFVEGLYRSCLFGLEKQVWYNSANSILVSLRWMGVIVLLHFVSNTIQAFFIWQAFISLFAVVTFSWKTYSALNKPEKPPHFSPEAVRKIWKFARGMLLITLLALLLTQIDKILLSKLLPLKQFGYYALATTVVSFISLVSNPVSQAIYPRMVAFVSQKKERDLIELYHTSSQLITAFTCPIFVMLSFFPYEFIHTWTNDAELSSNVSILLFPLALGTFLNTTMWIPYQLQLANGWTSFSLKVNAVAVLLLTPAILLVVPRYGAAGAAWVWVTLNFGYVLISVPIMHRYLIPKEKWKWFVADLFLPTLATICMAALLKTFQPQGVEHRIASACWLLLSSTFCVATALFSAGNLKARVKLLLTGLFYK